LHVVGTFDTCRPEAEAPTTETAMAASATRNTTATPLLDERYIDILLVERPRT